VTSCRGLHDITAGMRANDRHVRVYDLATGKLAFRLEGPLDGTWAVAWSPDGRLLAAGGEDGVTRVWAIATRRERFRLTGHTGPYTPLLFTGDRGNLITGGWDTSIFVGALPRPPGAPPADFATLWADLASPNAERAERAIRLLTNHPTEAAAMLRQKLRPVPAPVTAAVERLIAKLDAPAFTDRESAEAELTRLADAVLSSLKKAKNAPVSAETRRRLTKLIQRVEPEDGSTPDALLGVLRAVEALELIGTAGAKQALAEWSRGAAGAALTQE